MQDWGCARARELDDIERTMLGRNSVAFTFRNLGEPDGLVVPALVEIGLGWALAGTGDEDGELLG